MRGYISEELVTKETGLCSATQHFSYERMHERNKFPLPVDPDATRFFYRRKDYYRFLRHMINNFPPMEPLERVLFIYACRKILYTDKNPRRILCAHMILCDLTGAEPIADNATLLKALHGPASKIASTVLGL